MIVRVENQAEIEVSPGNTRASELYDFFGLVHADGWVKIVDNKLVVTWTTFIKDGQG